MGDISIMQTKLGDKIAMPPIPLEKECYVTIGGYFGQLYIHHHRLVCPEPVSSLFVRTLIASGYPVTKPSHYYLKDVMHKIIK